MARLLYLVNIPRFFVSHRLPLALAARAAGHEVHVATSAADGESVGRILDAGLPFHPLALSQHGTNILTEVTTFRMIDQLLRRLHPDLVHLVTVKPILYGGLAARRLGIPTVNAITGLGYVFAASGLKWTAVRVATTQLYRLALNHRGARTIFQNSDDCERFVRSGLVVRERAVVIKGSGVDMNEFSPRPEVEGVPLVLFAGRLLWQKGVGEFVEAARRLRAAGAAARFVIAGYSEPSSPAAVPEEKLREWSESGVIEWWGKRTDMPDVFAQAHIVCLPSSYGEGVPKVLIEAAASGRAIVTTDTSGCREIARHGENGLLIPPHDIEALTAALRTLIDQPDLRQRMGRRSREIAETEFSLELICSQTLAVYATLLAQARSSRGSP